MNIFQRLILLVSICGCAPLFAQTGTPIPSLSGTADGQFYIGAAVEPRQLQGPEGELLKRQVNTLTAENAMKMYALWTGNDSAAYRWAAADRIVNFARENGMKVRGHTLIWHNAPAAFFKDENGNDLDSAALYRRTEAYMRAVLTHFDSTVFCWDVVNEAIAERDGEGSIYRQDSPWYRICGADYIAWAFRTAHRIRPDMKLFYNDYSLVYPDKLQRTLTMLRQLLAEGVPIDGVGMQAHWNNAVTAEQIQTAVDSFAMLGLDIHIPSSTSPSTATITTAPARRPRPPSPTMPRQAGGRPRLTPAFSRYSAATATRFRRLPCGASPTTTPGSTTTP